MTPTIIVGLVTAALFLGFFLGKWDSKATPIDDDHISRESLDWILARESRMGRR